MAAEPGTSDSNIYKLEYSSIFMVDEEQMILNKIKEAELSISKIQAKIFDAEKKLIELKKQEIKATPYYLL